MNIVFMGTPDFAATILRALVEAGHNIKAVYTQPDKPQKRSSELIASPVKEYALTKGFTVRQPDRIRNADEIEVLKSFDADVFVVAAYGQILSQEILDIPRFCPVNVHGSLLPKYRGASPIQRAIADGEEVTGVTIMRMDKGVDTGDMIAKVAVPITDNDDEDTMYARLADEGSKLLIEVLKTIEAGTVSFTPQDDSEATYAPMIKKEDGLIDFTRSAREIDCKVRGFKKWPTAFTYVGGKMLKIFETKVVSDIPDADTRDFEPGCFVITKKKIYVTTGDGFIELVSVQPEGKKRMPGMDYQRGAHIENGMSIG